MIRVLKDKTYNFSTVFNDETGEYIRAFDAKEDPFMAEYPHLIDIGVMSTCVHGKSGLCMKAGVQCYQDGLNMGGKNMSLDDYKIIMNHSKGRLLEVALGGRGDPDMHENFEEILSYTREKGIVPNFTTSGLGMTPEKAQLCKKYCGGVAVSMYSRLESFEPELALRRVHSESGKKVYKSIDDIPVRFTFGNEFEECTRDDIEYKIDGLSYAKSKVANMYYDDEPQEYEFYRVFNEKQNPNYTVKAINMLLNAGVKTNIHYVLSIHL